MGSAVVGLKVREDLFYVTSTDGIMVHESLSKNYLGIGSFSSDKSRKCQKEAIEVLASRSEKTYFMWHHLMLSEKIIFCS